MKSPAGRTRPAAKKRVRLDLRRAAPPPAPDDEIGSRQQSNFWKWFGVVALFHLAVFVAVLVFYRPTATPPPPTDFISLVPQGDVVKGTPGEQAAPKVGASTKAHSHPHVAPKPPEPVTPQPPPDAVQLKPLPAPVKTPVIQDDDAPVVAKVKPPKPVPPKIKVDLNLADGPTPDRPVTKPKHVKKSSPPTADNQQDQTDDSSAETDGLSKAEIAAQLGKKLEAAGVSNATRIGKTGDVNGSDNPFGAFYKSLREQAMDKWMRPAQDDPQAVDPIVEIYVEKDGHVPPERVSLKRSSGNPTIDDSALNAARTIGYTLQLPPEGLNPDITINFQLTH